MEPSGWTRNQSKEVRPSGFHLAGLLEGSKSCAVVVAISLLWISWLCCRTTVSCLLLWFLLFLLLLQLFDIRPVHDDILIAKLRPGQVSGGSVQMAFNLLCGRINSPGFCCARFLSCAEAVQMINSNHL